MTPLIVSSLILAGGPITRFEVVLFSLSVGTVLLVAVGKGIVEDWIERTRGRNWPTVSAVIDIVSVAFIEDDGIPSPKADLVDAYYKATLTYSYNNPEKRMGEYSRDFANEDDAKAWANPTKVKRSRSTLTHATPRGRCCEEKTFRPWVST